MIKNGQRSPAWVRSTSIWHVLNELNDTSTLAENVAGMWGRGSNSIRYLHEILYFWYFTLWSHTIYNFIRLNWYTHETCTKYVRLYCLTRVAASISEYYTPFYEPSSNGRLDILSHSIMLAYIVHIEGAFSQSRLPATLMAYHSYCSIHLLSRWSTRHCLCDD